MENNFFDFIKNFSIETLIIGVIVFLLTMILKIPIKKKTSTLTEEKRKAVNCIIVIIPFVLGIICSLLYSGIFKHSWLSIDILEIGLTSTLLSFTINAIWEKIVILIKAISRGEIKISSTEAKEMIKEIKNKIKEISSKIESDNEIYNNLVVRLNELNERKSQLINRLDDLNLNELSQLNIEIQKLSNEENSLKKQISEEQTQLQNYTQKLNQ